MIPLAIQAQVLKGVDGFIQVWRNGVFVDLTGPTLFIDDTSASAQVNYYSNNELNNEARFSGLGFNVSG